VGFSRGIDATHDEGTTGRIFDVFQGEWYPSEQTIRMRKRLLAATLREYISAQCLAEDILEWLARGKEEDVRRFVVTILYGTGWLKQIPQTPEAATTQPIQPPQKEEVLMMG